ncbi:MAG TPA: DUF4159 domain-containing protein [Candidatus Acidoferrales bacterium]|jgi:hypothetical protein|nr:DUF4159 domain-containing protein [Candidatus Acidoferrales bacterium]
MTSARTAFRRRLPILLAALLFLSFTSGLLAYQRRGFGQYEDDDEAEMPIGARQKVEWTFVRFHYDMAYGGFRGFQRWAADYPKSDRQLVQGVVRLTRINTFIGEQVVDAHSDEIYKWPWIFVEDPGWWVLSPVEAARMRTYLLRGGFMFFDDTHGDQEWNVMMQGIHMIFPDRAVEDLKNNDEIFHTMYDLDDRFQIPGTRFIWNGRRYAPDMKVPRWSAVRDDKGRIMIAICHNSDVGDAWEWADSPDYPERATSMAYRIAINYIIYGMTH